ncbi:MAG: ABC transporter ATP-binding protein [Eubacteriaceae bacterium]
MNTAIKVENLVKSYGNNTVIKEISFKVSTGETFALLGINGAGKTTTLECIEGLRKYDSGNINVNGSIGVQLQLSSLPINITALESFKLFAKWKKADFDVDLFNSLALKDLKNKKYKEMSTGQKRRLHLAIALIDNPDILFLDEPTAGLDVEGRNTLHEIINTLKSRGKTIILASHDMAEVESLCDRIAILKEGSIAFMGTPRELTTQISTESKIHVKLIQEYKVLSLQNSSYKGIERGYHVFITSNIGEALLELLALLKKSENIVLDIRIEHTSLEQSFMDISKECN